MKLKLTKLDEYVAIVYLTGAIFSSFFRLIENEHSIWIKALFGSANLIGAFITALYIIRRINKADNQQDRQQDRNDFLSSLVGLSEEEATKLCIDKGYSVRVIKRNGEYCLITLDYHTDRVNLYINQYKIYEADFG